MTLSNREFEEKRDYIRMRTQMDGTLTHQGREIPIVCRDLSAKGMQIEAGEGLEIGARVKVHIPSAHETLPGLDADGEVVRSIPGENGLHLIGLAIHDMQ